MSYQILNADGTLLLTLSDDIVDTSTTSLSLVGKDVRGYGQYILENFVQLLENSASPNPPISPQSGQLWFNKTSSVLSVYYSSSWNSLATETWTNQTIGSALGSYATESYVGAQIALSEISPIFSGIPEAPTAAVGTNTTQLATTAFVTTAHINGGSIINTPVSATTLVVSQAITPSTTYGIIGTTLGDNANTGAIGEYQEIEILQANGVSLVNGINVVVGTFTLSPGDWNVWATIVTQVSEGCIVNQLAGGASQNTGLPSRTSGGLFYLILSETGAQPGLANIGGCFPCGIQRMVSATPMVVNLIITADFMGGTVTGYGGLFARRMR